MRPNIKFSITAETRWVSKRLRDRTIRYPVKAYYINGTGPYRRVKEGPVTVYLVIK
jgi:hypothetical protein